MFKKFTKEDHVSTVNQVKSSIARGIRASICESYPWLEESRVIDELIPKKEPFYVAKCPGYLQVVTIRGVPLFFSTRDSPWLPTLRLLHQYPLMMKRLRVDTGAIKYVLSGAMIMAPGLTSPGATIHQEMEAEEPVAIYAEDKEHALAVGLLSMSTADMRELNKGTAVENLHHLNDGLWKMLELS